MKNLVNKEDWKFDIDIKNRILGIPNTGCFILYSEALAGDPLNTVIIKKSNC